MKTPTPRTGGLRLPALVLCVIGLGEVAMAGTVQSFNNLAHETPFTLGVTPGYGSAPLAPTQGYLRMVESGDRVNKRPYVVFEPTEDLAGSLATDSVVIEFDYRGPGGSSAAEGFGVALLNTAHYGTTGAIPVNTALIPANDILGTSFAWQAPALKESFAVGFDLYENKSNPTRTTGEIHLYWNGVKQATYDTEWDATASASNEDNKRFVLRSSNWARVRIEVRKDGADSLVTLKFTTDINTSNPVTFDVFTDKRITGMNLTDTRLGFGVKTGGSITTLIDLDNVRTFRLPAVNAALSSLVYGLDDGAVPPPASQTQALDGAAGSLGYTSSAYTGLVPAAPSGGILSLLRVTTVNPINSRPRVLFDNSPLLSGPSANGSVKLQFDYRMSSGNSTPADGLGVALLATDGSGNVSDAALTATANERPKPAGSFAVGFDIYESGTSDPARKNQVNLNWAGAQVSSGTQGFTPFNLKNNLWNRVIIEVRKSGANSLVSLRIIENVNGTTPVAHTIYDDFLVTGMNLPDTRLAFGARTGGSWVLCDLDNIVLGPGEIHVAPNTSGNDTNSGTSTSPVRTLATAVQKASPGDTIVLNAGTHTLSNGNATVATLVLDKRLNFVGQGATGANTTTITGDWTDTLSLSTDLGNPLIRVNVNGEGSTFSKLDFKGGEGLPQGATAWTDAYHPIGGGIELNGTDYIAISDSVLRNFRGSAVRSWHNRNLNVENVDVIDSGFGQYQVAVGPAGSEAGAFVITSLWDGLFDSVSILNTTGLLGTGYGFKIGGDMVNNVFNDLTIDLKTGSSWRNGPNAGAAPTFSMEATEQKYNISQLARTVTVRGNVITGSTLRNPFSLQQGGVAALSTGQTSYHIHDNVFDTKGEYVIEGGTDNLLLEYNHSKNLSFYNNTGAQGRNITLRFNIVENVDDYFVRIDGNSDGLKVYHNTVTTQSRTVNNVLRTPTFFQVRGGELASTGRTRDIRNNVVVGPGGSNTVRMVVFNSQPTGDFSGTTISNNHVYLGELTSFYASGGTYYSASAYISLAGNQGGTAAANNPLFVGGSSTDPVARFSLQSTSPLRNVGANLGQPGTDSTPDIGRVQN